MGSILASLPVFQGKKPDVPDYNPVDIYGEQRNTIKGNLAALPDETLLAQRTNQANLQGTQSLFSRAMPGSQQMQELTEKALLSYLRGEIPSDVSSAIGRAGNARSFAGGYGGSGMGRNLVARDLGRTSEENIRYGLGASQNYMRNNPVLSATPRYAVGNSFLSPQFTIPLREQQNQTQWQRNWLNSQVEAAPEPWAAHLGQTLDSIADTALSVAASYAGGMGGSGAGKTQSSIPKFNYGGGTMTGPMYG